MFNMKFHADERSMDMSRRRRWHRKMVPSAEHNLNDLVANTDIVFRMQSQVQAITDSTTKSDSQSTDSSPTTTTTNKEVKIELNAPRMFLTFKSKIIQLMFNEINESLF